MDNYCSLHIGPSMSMSRIDEIIAENQTKSEFGIGWEQTPVHFDCQVEAKRFWITLLKVVHCNDLPKTIEVHFRQSKDVHATSPSPGNGLNEIYTQLC